MFGTDIFGPVALEAQAKELLEAYRNGEIVEDEDSLPSEDEK